MGERNEGKTKEIWGRTFRIVKNGLDESEIFAFIGNLIDQNNEYATRLDNLNSLRKLADSTVIEATRQAESILTEIEHEANETAVAIISEAESKAHREVEDIITAAKKQANADAEQVLSEARESAQQTNDKAGQTLAEAESTAQDKILQAEMKAKDILEQAHDEAEKRRALADEESSEIISRAKQEAEESAAAILKAAKEQRKSLLQAVEDEVKTIRENAENEMHKAKQGATDLLERSKRLAESEIKKTFEKIYMETLSSLETKDSEEEMEYTADTSPTPETPLQETGTLIETEITDHELPEQPHSEKIEVEYEDEAIIREQQVTITDEAQAEKDSIEQSDETTEEDSLPLYEGTVELQVTAPVAFDRMLQLHKDLRQIPEVEITSLSRPTDKGLTIELHLINPLPLLKILGELPEIQTVVDPTNDSENSKPRRRSRAKISQSKLVITTKE